MPKLQITMQRRPCIGVVRFALRVMATYRRYVTFLMHAHLTLMDSAGAAKRMSLKTFVAEDEVNSRGARRPADLIQFITSSRPCSQ